MKNNNVLIQGRNRMDAHLHSILSDGENTLAEIIELAFKEGMRMISVTDHNLFAITKRFEISADGSYLEVIPGCEFSTTYYVPTRGETTEVHVIGLFPDSAGVNPEDFVDIFSEISEGKLNYIKAILDKLETLDIHVSMEEVLEVQRKTGHIGRHQISDVLVQKGYANTVDEAMDLYVGNYSPYYISATKFINYAALDVVTRRIKECHGFPILCHPFGYSLDLVEISNLINEFNNAAEGVGGIELYYEKYNGDSEKLKFLHEQQDKYGLLASVASDRHRMDQPFATGGDYSCYQEMLRVMKEKEIIENK